MKTDKSLKELNEKKINNYPSTEPEVLSPASSKFKGNVMPTVLSVSKPIIKDISQRRLKVGEIVAMNVSPEHHIPGQPCIGELKSLPIGKDFAVVHFYTGTYNGTWIPMMSRQSPYLREVKITDIIHTFQFDSENCLPRDVIELLKK